MLQIIYRNREQGSREEAKTVEKTADVVVGNMIDG